MAFEKQNKIFDNGFSSLLSDIRAGMQREMNVSQSVSTYAAESMNVDPTLEAELRQLENGIRTQLQSLGKTHKLAFEDQSIDGRSSGGEGYSAASIEAASSIALLGRAGKSLLGRSLAVESAVVDGARVIPAPGGDFFDSRNALALEAFDNQDNRNALVFSVAYNLTSARQNEFGEAFFRTITLSPEQFGFHVNVNLIQVQNEVRRGITGALTDFGRRNLIQADIDASILRDDTTRLVPVYRDEAASSFISKTLISPFDVPVDGISVPTLPLAMGVETDVLSLAQTDELLKAGVADHSDSIDPSVRLQNLYVTIQNADGSTKELIKFNVENLPYAYFNAAVQGNMREMNVNFQTKRLMVTKTIKQVDGSASALLKTSVIDQDVVVRLGVSVMGRTNLELGSTLLNAMKFEVISVRKAGVTLAKTDAVYKAVETAFAGAQVSGYDLDMWRTNSNRRQYGQRLNTNLYSQLYSVQFRSPISIPRPVNSNDQTDATDLQSLVMATRKRTSAAAVTELIRIEGLLRDFVSADDGPTEDAEILGVARMLLTKPYFYEKNIDIAAQVDSLKTSERRLDIQAVLVNEIRDRAVRMYRDSGFKAAADALCGGVSEKPVLLLGTDPVTASYLVKDGDMRLAGDQFSVKIVETLDNRVTGKIYMTFIVPDAPEGTVHPLNFGYCAWRPEYTLILPVTKNGQTSKELTVTPSFRHIGNLPVLSVFTVEGIEDVVASKVTFNTHTVP